MKVTRTIEQKRSEFALNCVTAVKDKDFAGNYKGLVKKFPMMILKNGLLQSLAFVEAKGKIGIKPDIKRKESSREKSFKEFYRHIQNYVNSVSSIGLKIPPEKLMSDFLSSINLSAYRDVTTDILAFLKWLGRYAEAIIEQEVESE